MRFQHQIVAIEPSPASEPGALSGFEAVCSCGERIKSSLRTLAVSWGHDHANYMNNADNRRRTP